MISPDMTTCFQQLTRVCPVPNDAIWAVLDSRPVFLSEGSAACRRKKRRLFEGGRKQENAEFEQYEPIVGGGIPIPQ
jgi:hypothetical protein